VLLLQQLALPNIITRRLRPLLAHMPARKNLRRRADLVCTKE